ncbi:hypothetical protein [Nitrosomonas communis]|uniref:Uncharacterized protein n=1 Tax=Nitrosomonas communis TaxID=44574 RepID=A0A1I4VLJ4_9PROT|nr:hypothetical protein [Nitrosomonas communis]SFN02144.1 hypothetical protein SAMN05421863_10867 [Nitrosomonas communis]
MAEDKHLDRFVGAADIRIVTSPCATYIHRSQKASGYCLAFPEGIPKEILSGKNDHRKPFAGDHDIQYESSKR